MTETSNYFYFLQLKFPKFTQHYYTKIHLLLKNNIFNIHDICVLARVEQNCWLIPLYNIRWCRYQRYMVPRQKIKSILLHSKFKVGESKVTFFAAGCFLLTVKKSLLILHRLNQNYIKSKYS